MVSKMEWYRDGFMSQKEINELSYPCTHMYILDTLEPVDDLAERMKIIPHDFFIGDKFLDVGSSKGFFSLLAKKGCNYVESIEPRVEYYNLCVKLGLNVKNTSFRDFTTDVEFDRIMVGNVIHYLYRESGWDFIKKLACISTDLILVECPTERCSDLLDMFPGYNFNEFKLEMSKFFTLLWEVNSSSPDRKVMMYKRKEDQFSKRYELRDLVLGNTIKSDTNSATYSSNVITKIYSEVNKNAIKIASLSPISNGLTGFVYDGDKCVGWCEDKLEGKLLLYKEQQKIIFKKICEHGRFLARVGYWDIDTATINFINGFLFDKGAVIPISEIDEKMIGFFEIMLRNSYDILTDEYIAKLKEILNTKDSKKIEGMYELAW